MNRWGEQAPAATPPSSTGVEPGPWHERLPRVIADHELLRQIGQGSYGGVWLAQNKLTRVYRAIKIIFKNYYDREKPYQREFEAIKRFEPISRSHPGFVHILQVGEIEHAFYYIMELGDDDSPHDSFDPNTYRARTLGRYRSRTMPLENAIETASCLAECLEVLHSARLIHRDIKPSNVIFVNGKPKLADIGLVAHIDEAKSFVGTTGFIPPEGPISPRSDIYSLGKLLYEISTGKDRLQFPELPETVSKENTLLLEVNQIILKACHHDPSRRYASARDLKGDLELLQTGRSIKRLRTIERRLRMTLAALVAVAVSGLVFLAIWSEIQRRERVLGEERQRQFGALIARGTEHLKRGDFAAAFEPFLQAALDAQTDIPTHQLRLGSLLANAVRPVHQWKTMPGESFLSQDGVILAVENERKAHLFNATNGTLLAQIPLDGKLLRVGDNGQIASAAGTHLRIFDFRTGETFSRTCPEEIVNIAFSPSEQEHAILLTNNTILIESPARSARLRETNQIWRVEFTADGNGLFTYSFGGYVRLWNLDTRVADSFAPHHVQIAYDACFLRNGEILVTAGFDRRAVAWDMRTHEQIGLDMTHLDAVGRIAVSPNGRLLATGGLDNAVKLWDTASFRPLAQNHVLYQPGRVSEVAFLDDETLLVVMFSHEVILWDVKPEKPAPRKLTQRVIIPHKITIQRDGLALTARDRIVTGQSNGTNIHLVFPAPVSVIAVDPSTSIMAIGTLDGTLDPHEARLFSTSGAPLGIRLPHQDGITHAVFSHTGDKLAVTDESFCAILWDPKTGEQLTPPMRHGWQVHWAAFSSDDRWLATASLDQTVVIWDTTTGEPITPPIEFPDALTYVAFTGPASIIAGGAQAQYEVDLPLAPLPFADLRHSLISPD